LWGFIPPPKNPTIHHVFTLNPEEPYLENKPVMGGG
jgi:hypothetical protein